MMVLPLLLLLVLPKLINSQDPETQKVGVRQKVKVLVHVLLAGVKICQKKQNKLADKKTVTSGKKK